MNLSSHCLIMAWLYAMVKETLRVEIAEIPIRINNESSLSRSYLKDRLRGFYSLRKPEFDFTIVNGNISLTDVDYEDAFFLIDVISKGSHFKFYIKSRPHLLLGTLDSERRECRFIHRNLHMSEMYLMPFLRAAFELLLTDLGGFLIHSCGLARDKNSYLFPGPSGCGKTTISRLSQGFRVLSDEFICVRKIQNQIFIYSTPWQGKLQRQQRYPLRRIFFPSRSESLSFERLKPAAAITEIFPNIIYPHYNRELSSRIIDLLLQIVKRIPCYRMYFSLASRFWERLDDDS